ncbi:MAG: Rieske 2Fe-2S domain-containing protein [Planctomycetes bacterium]|nr:Rieske 2Fe-2S domain-containing protein [Planctomycetota bacterium]
MNDRRGYRSGLVDLRAGEISREIFVNEHIYAEEQERIFARAWLHVGHESQIPKPGDYFVSSMGEESVILCRDRANRIHVFLNSCRHRGMKVCRYDQGEVPLQPVGTQAGVFKFPSKDMFAYPVRVTGSDLCGNVANREVHVKDLIAANVRAENMRTEKVGFDKVGETVVTANKTEPHPLPANLGTEQARQEPKRPPAFPPVEKFNTASNLSPASGDPLASAATSGESTAKALLPVSTLPAGALPRQLLSTTQASIEYRIAQVGPSGVGKVEVYLTTDNGQTWKRHAEDADRRSPAEIVLPGEGVFGIRLVVTNGNGFGGAPPTRGDVPTCLIEVDTTAPFVQMRPIEPIAQNGCLEICWTATDKHLGPEPVSLFYRARAEGPWQVIARNVKNDGLYRWAFPRDMGPQFFVKIEVVDQAGNTAHTETPNPIVLDMTEPRISVVGVSGMSRSKE